MLTSKSLIKTRPLCPDRLAELHQAPARSCGFRSALAQSVVKAFGRLAVLHKSGSRTRSLKPTTALSAVQAAGKMRVVPVPMLSDNYAYLLIDSEGTTAAVDPVEPEKIIQAAEKENVKVTTILTTHHHWDHAGGNEKFTELAPGITVIGGVNDKVAACTQTVQDDEHISMGKIKIRCIETPFHTQGHICFACEEPGSSDKIVFTGDTLFIAGCGRCFVGTPEQMYSALVGKLSKLPPETKVYCGHEYTLSNLKFAMKADGGNQAVKDKLDWAQRQRDASKATIPSTIGEELQYNPFLRCKEPALQKFTGKTDPVDVIGQTRKLKDQG